MKTGIIFPMPKEMGDFANELEGGVSEMAGAFEVHTGSRKGLEIAALVCGMCKTNAAAAAQLLIDRYDVGRIIVCGVAGGMELSLRAGDTVIVTQAAHHDISRFILDMDDPTQAINAELFAADPALLDAARQALEVSPHDCGIAWGRCVTGECFILEEGRQDIMDRLSPLCVDMETAAIAHVCRLNSIPWLAIRSISDAEGQPYAEFVNLAAANSRAVLGRLLDWLAR